MNNYREITVYDAETTDKSIFTHFRDIFRELPEAHQLGLRLFKRNLKAMYRQSILGLTWALLPPLITAGLWIFLKGNGVADFGYTKIPYAVFVLTGTMLWQVFTESVLAPINEVNSNKALLAKINIPREGLLLSGIYMVFFNALIKIIFLAIIFIVYKQTITISLIWVLPGILSIIISGFALGLVLTPLGMLYNDIQRGLNISLPFLMYLTPVIYDKPVDGLAATLMNLNPMATILVDTRNWFTAQPVHDVSLFISLVIGFAILTFFATMLYRISMPMIIERIGS